MRPWPCAPALLLAFGLPVGAGTDGASATPHAWAELTPAQQEILTPLEGAWQSLDANRRLKWLNIARRFHDLDSIGRERLKRRMLAWALLTPEERSAARARYRAINELPPEERRGILVRWRDYQRHLAERQNPLR
jgi:hypothetical protein